MKLHSSAFDGALRHKIKQAVRADPELRKESRRSNKRPRNRWLGWVFRLLISFLLAAFVGRAIQATHHVDAALMVINLWILTMVIGFAQSLLQLPFSSSDIAALRLLPAQESILFRWEWDKFLKSSLFCLSDLTAGFATLGVILDLSPIQWTFTLVLIPLTGAFMLALAALCAARFPQLPYASISASLYLLWFIVFITARFMGPSLLTFIDQAAPTFNLLVPTGWPLSLFHLLLPDRGWSTGILVLPIGLILWTFKDSIELLRARFVYYEPIFDEASDLVPGEEAPATASMDNSIQPVRRPIGTTAIGEGILSGQFLCQEGWIQGWLERRLWRWFNKHEKALAEFAFPTGLAITRPWKKIARNFLIVAFLGFIAGTLSSPLEFVIFGIGLFIISCQVMGQILSTGAAFGAVMINGVQIPVYAAYPITFRDLSRTLLKCSAIQMPLFTLLMMAIMVLLTRCSGLTVAMSIIIGINASLVFWGARFFLLVFSFSSGSNDSSTFGLRSLTLFVFFALFGSLFLILAVFTAVFSIAGAVSGIISDLQLVLWIGSILTLLDGYAFFRIYGWFYHANRFDLMRLPA